MSGVLLIDGNSVGFSAHSTTKLTAGDQETQAIFGFIRTMRVLRESWPYKPIILWDGRSWRKDANADYKANRDKNAKMTAMRDAYKAQRPLISRACRGLGLTQVMAMNLEADDLAGIFTAKFKAKGLKVVLVTGDKDWLQLVDDGVIWYDFIRENKVTLGEFAEYTGYASPAAFVEGKALQGDTSDNIKGVGGIGAKGAESLLAEWGSVDAFLTAYELGKAGKLGKRLQEFADNTNGGIERFRENIRLMDLRGAYTPKPERLTVQSSSYNPDEFMRVCEELAFISIIKDFENWCQPFSKRAA